MNLINYKTFYVNDEGHWYVSKIKQYDEYNINIMAQGLLLLSDLLSPSPEPKMIKKFNRFKPKDKSYQVDLFGNRIKQIPIEIYSQLFLSLEILAGGLIDLEHLKKINPEKFNIFCEIEKNFRDGKEYIFFIEKYGINYLKNEFTVYFRNFFSWLAKYGFIGKQSYSNYCFITDAGKEFSRSSKNYQATSALFCNQIKKVQVWNPTLPQKYGNFKVVPYYLILQLLSLLPEHNFTRTEYALFVTKIKSHRDKDIQTAVDLIQAFRSLSSDEQNEYINDINLDDSKRYPKRNRKNFERLIDSSGKEIFAYTFGGLISIQNGIVQLLNTEKSKQELIEFQKSPGYIEFQTKQDWIRHLGSLGGLELDEIIDIYVRNGKNTEEIKNLLKNVEENIDVKIEDRLLESEIETFYIHNIEQIHPNLKILYKPKYGRQFQTDIGVIDTLCKDVKTNQFVVIEFKRSQVSDATIGQVLRYMGWVSFNMEHTGKKVRGIIVGRDFSEKLLYSIFGVQDESFLKLLTLYSHKFDKNNRPTIGKE